MAKGRRSQGFGANALVLLLAVLAAAWLLLSSATLEDGALSLGPLRGGFTLEEGRVGVGTLTVVTGKSVYAATLVYARGPHATTNLSVDLARLDETLTQVDEPPFPPETPDEVRALYGEACERVPCANESTRIAAGEEKLLRMLGNASLGLADALGVSNASAEGRVVAGRDSTIIIQLTQAQLGEARAREDAAARATKSMEEARAMLVRECEERDNLTGLACDELYLPFSVSAKLDWSLGPKLRAKPPLDTFVVGPMSWRTAQAGALVDAERPDLADLPAEAVLGAKPVYLPLRVLLWSAALWSVSLVYNRGMERVGLVASLPVSAFAALTLLFVLWSVAFRKLLFGSVAWTVILPFVALYGLVLLAYLFLAPGLVHSGNRLAGTLANVAVALALAIAAVALYAYERDEFLTSLYDDASAHAAGVALAVTLASGFVVVMLLLWPTIVKRAVAAFAAHDLDSVPAAPEEPALPADWLPAPHWTDRVALALTSRALERRILVGRWANGEGVARRVDDVAEALGDVYWLTHRIRAMRRAKRQKLAAMLTGAPWSERRKRKVARKAERGAWLFAAGGVLKRASGAETREEMRRRVGEGFFTEEAAIAAEQYVELLLSHREAIKAARREAAGQRPYYAHGRVSVA